MFGGLAFLIGGNMAIAASGEGGLLVRIDPRESARLIATTNAQEMEMRGRPMTGWLRVAAPEVRTKRQLSTWVRLGARYAASLPPKVPKRSSHRSRATRAAPPRAGSEDRGGRWRDPPSRWW
jgi:hypothetical protein